MPGIERQNLVVKTERIIRQMHRPQLNCHPREEMKHGTWTCCGITPSALLHKYVAGVCCVIWYAYNVPRVPEECPQEVLDLSIACMAHDFCADSTPARRPTAGQVTKTLLALVTPAAAVTSQPQQDSLRSKYDARSLH